MIETRRETAAQMIGEVVLQVYMQTAVELSAHPLDMGMATTFDALGLDDAAVNNIAEACAKGLKITIQFPVSCNTLGELGLLLYRAEKVRP